MTGRKAAESEPTGATAGLPSSAPPATSPKRNTFSADEGTGVGIDNETVVSTDYEPASSQFSVRPRVSKALTATGLNRHFDRGQS